MPGPLASFSLRDHPVFDIAWACGITSPHLTAFEGSWRNPPTKEFSKLKDDAIRSCDAWTPAVTSCDAARCGMGRRQFCARRDRLDTASALIYNVILCQRCNLPLERAGGAMTLAPLQWSSCP
jgi:hypothetical protein